MASVRKCDRCGAYHGWRENHAIKMDGYIKDGFSGTYDYYANDYDLCPECRDEFIEFMKGVPAPSLLERLRAIVKRKD